MARRLDDERPPLAPPAEVSISGQGDSDDSVSSRTVEICVRSLSDEVQPLLEETLRLLRETSDVDEVNVVVWGRCFDPTGPAADTTVGRALADRLESFREWAAANGASFGPFFRTRTVRQLTGQTCTRVDLPTVALAEYHDGELAFVAPCRIDDRYHHILDRVRAIVEGEPVSTASEEPRTFEPTGENGASIRT